LRSGRQLLCRGEGLLQGQVPEEIEGEEGQGCEHDRVAFVLQAGRYVLRRGLELLREPEIVRPLALGATGETSTNPAIAGFVDLRVPFLMRPDERRENPPASKFFRPEIDSVA
jgi:hypothetical protein